MAITFDAAAGQKTTGASTNTFSHTVAAGQSNEIILVTVDCGATVNSVTYGGQTLTQLASTTGQGGGEIFSVWYLLGPPTGANNVVVTCAASTFIIAASASYYNVAQSSTFGTAATNASSSGQTSSTNTVTTTASNQLVYDTVNNTAAGTDTPTASQTKRGQPASSGAATGDIAATGSNMTLTWSFPSANWAQISVAMNPASGVALSDTLAGVGTLAGTLSLATALSVTFAGVGTLNGTLPSTAPTTTVTAYGRDGIAHAYGRDGKVAARGRDGIVQARGH